VGVRGYHHECVVFYLVRAASSPMVGFGGYCRVVYRSYYLVSKGESSMIARLHRSLVSAINATARHQRKDAKQPSACQYGLGSSMSQSRPETCTEVTISEAVESSTTSRNQARPAPTKRKVAHYGC